MPESLPTVFRDEKERSADRIAAARELWNRRWGKAPAFAYVDSHEISAIANELRVRFRANKP